MQPRPTVATSSKAARAPKPIEGWEEETATATEMAIIATGTRAATARIAPAAFTTRSIP